MKKNFPFKLALLVVAASSILYQCAKEDLVEQLSSTKTSGTDVVDTYTKDSQDSIWDLEDHSRLFAEFLYEGEATNFTAEFVLWDCELKFDEANPANSKIEAVVYTRSVQTGAPAGTEILKKVDGTDSIARTTTGRDGEIFATAAPFYIKASDATGIVGRKFQKDFYLNGCLTKPKTVSGALAASTLGITSDGTKDVWSRYLPTGVTNNSDKATFKSSSVEKLGTGYLAKGTFTWNGKTEDVQLKFKYLGQGATTRLRTFEGEFDFSAYSNGFINDIHVKSDVKIKINTMFMKKKFV